MGQRFRRGFTAAEKTELWDRWQRGESLKAIGRAFGKLSSSIYFQVAPHGGIRPAPRRRSRLALTLSEREEISRGIAALPRRWQIAMNRGGYTLRVRLVNRPSGELVMLSLSLTTDRIVCCHSLATANLYIAQRRSDELRILGPQYETSTRISGRRSSL